MIAERWEAGVEISQMSNWQDLMLDEVQRMERGD